MSADEKEVRKYTRESIGEAINKIAELKDNELDKLLSDEDGTQLEKIMAKVMLEARKSGDFTQFDKMLDRCIGRVPQPIEGSPDRPIGYIVIRTPDERKEPGSPAQVSV